MYLFIYLFVSLFIYLFILFICLILFIYLLNYLILFTHFKVVKWENRQKYMNMNGKEYHSQKHNKDI